VVWRPEFVELLNQFIGDKEQSLRKIALKVADLVTECPRGDLAPTSKTMKLRQAAAKHITATYIVST